MGPSQRQPGLVVGIENAFRTQQEAEDSTYVHRLQMIQWVMAARQGHPVVCGMGRRITEFLAAERKGEQLVSLVRRWWLCWQRVFQGGVGTRCRCSFHGALH